MYLGPWEEARSPLRLGWVGLDSAPLDRWLSDTKLNLSPAIRMMFVSSAEMLFFDASKPASHRHPKCSVQLYMWLMWAAPLSPTSKTQPRQQTKF